MPTPNVRARFSARWRLDPSSGCHVWTGSGVRDGYGAIRDAGKSHRAHRMAWMLARGPIPDGMCVLHRCDNPRCVNAEHLFLGTQIENVADRNAKGRQARGASFAAVRRANASRGEANGRAKLSAADAREIRGLYERGGTSYRQLADRFGVSNPVIGQIVRGERWSHVAATHEAVGAR